MVLYLRNEFLKYMVYAICLAVVPVCCKAGSQPLMVTCPDNVIDDITPLNSQVITWAAPACTASLDSFAFCNPPSGTNFQTGATSVACSCVGLNFEFQACTFTVTLNSGSVTDITPPVITNCPANQNQLAGTGQTGVVVNFNNPGCSDLVTVNPIVTCSPGSGSFFPISQNTVTCQCVDDVGLMDSCSFAVTITEVYTISKPQFERVNPMQNTSFICNFNWIPTGWKYSYPGNFRFRINGSARVKDGIINYSTVKTISSGFSRSSNLTYNIGHGFNLLCFVVYRQVGADTATTELGDSVQVTPFALPTFHEPAPLSFKLVRSNQLIVTWPDWNNATDQGDGPAIGYILYHRQHTNRWSSTSLIEETSYTVSELVEGAVYDFAIAVVREGPGGTGPMSISQTKEYRSATCMVITARAQHNDLEKSLAVTWNFLDSEDCNIHQFRLEYYLKSHIACGYDAQNQEHFQITLSAASRIKNITDLQDFAKYDITITALDINDRVIHSAIIIGTTRAGVPDEPPSVTYRGEKNERLRFSSNILPCESLNGLNPTYNYILKEHDSNTEVQEGYAQTRGRIIVEVPISDLKACQTYDFQIRVENEGFEGPYSNTSTVTVGVKAFEAVGNLEVRPTQPRTLNISWQAPSAEANVCTIDGYRISVSMERLIACGRTQDLVINETTPSNFYELTGLSHFAEYPVVVTAFDSQSTGTAVEVNGRTLESAPSGILSVTSQINDSQLTFSWADLDCTQRNGVISSYHYELNNVTQTTNTKYVKVSQVVPCKTYRFRVRASTGETRLGPWSNISEVTAASAAHGQVQSVVHESTSTGISLRWRQPNRLDNECPLTGYRIRYYLQHYKACASTTISREYHYTTVTSTSATLSGLHAFATYQIEIIPLTTNDARGTTFSLSADTLLAAPSGGLSVTSNIVGSQLTFSWADLDCTQRNGVISSYHFELNNVTQTTNTKYVNVSPIVPCKTYWFRVRASTGKTRLGPWSNISVVTAASAIHGPVRNFRQNRNTNSSISLRWNAPNQPPSDCQVISYKIKYHNVKYKVCPKAKDPRIHPIRIINPPMKLATLTSLAAYSVYFIEISAVGIDGNGTSANITGETLPSRPSGPPTKFSVESVTARAIRLTWKVPRCADRNGDILNYTVTVRKETEIIHDVVKQGKQILIENLTPFTTYSVTVSAINSEGEGPPNSLVNRTLEDVPTFPQNLQTVFANKSHICVSWDAPSSPNGILLNYTIEYAVSTSLQSLSWKLGGNPQANGLDPMKYIVTDLLPNTNYTFRVRTRTSVGDGPWSNVTTGITKEGRPGSPTNLIVRAFTHESIHLQWQEPIQPNGHILRYEVKYRVVSRPYEKEFQASTDYNPSESMLGLTHIVTGLEPATKYEFVVAAFTVTGEGEQIMINKSTKPPSPESLEVINKEDIKFTPLSDEMTKITFPTVKDRKYITLFRIFLDKPSKSTRRKRSIEEPCDFNLFCYVAGEVPVSDEKVEFTIGDGSSDEKFNNTPLVSGENYALSIGTVSQSDDSGESVKLSPFISFTAGKQSSNLIVPVVITILILLVVVVFGVMFYVRLQGRKDKSKQYISQNDDAPAEQHNLVDLNPTYSNDGISDARKEKPRPLIPSTKPKVKSRKSKYIQREIQIKELAKYVTERKENANGSLADDYATLPDGQQHPWKVASKPENKKKNRYGNIIAYDHSRVVLEVYNGDEHSDYYNASYLDGYEAPKKYIACQGPNIASVKDFWRMVWQENCGKIVMLTNLFEGGKKKCELYWPAKTMKYADISVTCTSTQAFSDYALKTFEMQKNGSGEVKVVYHFHYTSWPDMGVPQYSSPLLNFLNITRDKSVNLSGPTIVHCSAGVGRTGTFITLDAMFDQGAAGESLNVYDFVASMRNNRIKMVQVPEQYVFIFDALVQYFVVGSTSIGIDNLRAEINSLHSVNAASKKTYMTEQFELLDVVYVHPAPEKCSGGRDTANKGKNRYDSIIPLDRKRPYLMTDVGNGGTNYINASFLDGYGKKDLFLGTQMPLPSTVIDFWRMVWDYQSETILMLNELDPNDEWMTQYWPNSGTSDFGPFTVKLIDQQKYGTIVCRSLQLNCSLHKENPRTIQQVQYEGWPNDVIVPDSPSDILSVIGQMEQWRSEKGHGPITVHCMNGVGRTGMVCALISVLEQIKAQQQADVFQIVNRLRNSRPRMVETVEQYAFIFQAVLHHMEAYSIYENFAR